jgi:hypothetical protein
VERAGAGVRPFPALLPFRRCKVALIIARMERPTFQMTVASMLGLVACIALNFWLFRLGVFWGILGLNVTKHVAIAYLCQILGVDRHRSGGAIRVVPSRVPQVPVS